MSLTIRWIALLVLVTLTRADDDCGSKGIHCVNTTTYQTCSYFLWWVKYGDYEECATGTACDEEDGEDACLTVTTTTTAPTTSITEPANSCGDNGVHCVNDTTYRKCVELLGIYIYSGNYQTCESGTVCDENGGNVSCSTITTTTELTTTIQAEEEEDAWWCWIFLYLFC